MGDGLPRAAAPTRVRYAVLAALCLAATVAYLHRNCLGLVEDTIRRDLGLDKEAMGRVMSAFYLTYALVQLPSGWLGHVWGTRRALSVFAVAWSALTGLGGLAGGFAALFLTRLGMGAAQAGIFPCAISSIARWFPTTARGLPSGILTSFMSVGAAVAALLTGLLLPHLGWRWLFVLYAVLGFAWAGWFAAWFRDDPAEHRSVNPGELLLIRGTLPLNPETPDRAREPTPWRALFASAALWYICGQQFFRAAAYLFYASWFPTYLKETFHVDMLEAGVLTSLPFWGVGLGSPLGGAFSDALLRRTGSRRLARQGLAVGSLAAAAVLVLAALPVPDVVPAVLLFSASAFCAAVAGACAYVITIDMGGRHVAPVFSTMNMSGNVGALLVPVVVPYLVEATHGWDLVLVSLAGTYLAAAACWALLNPNETVGNPGRAGPKYPGAGAEPSEGA